ASSTRTPRSEAQSPRTSMAPHEPCDAASTIRSGAFKMLLPRLRVDLEGRDDLQRVEVDGAGLIQHGVLLGPVPELAEAFLGAPPTETLGSTDHELRVLARDKPHEDPASVTDHDSALLSHSCPPILRRTYPPPTATRGSPPRPERRRGLDTDGVRPASAAWSGTERNRWVTNPRC